MQKKTSFERLQSAMIEVASAAREALEKKVPVFVVMSPFSGGIYTTTRPEGSKVLAKIDPAPLEIRKILGLPPVAEADLLVSGMIALSRLSQAELLPWLLPWEEEERIDAQ